MIVVALSLAGAVRAQPLSGPAPVIPTADPARIDLTETNRQIGILLGHDDKAAADLVDRIEHQPGDFSPPVIIFMANRLFDQNDRENAYFWFCFGRLRFLYDAERCADVTARSAFGEMMSSIKPDLRRYPTQMKPDDIVPFAKRVLHLDSVTPSNYDLHWINLHGKAVFSDSGAPLSVPEAEWADLHRKICNDYLNGAVSMAEEVKAMAENQAGN